MDFKGQRFIVNLSDSEEDDRSHASKTSISEPPPLMSAFVGDIKERAEVSPPSVPTFKSTATGFPEHKKRSRVSAFKQQRGASVKSVFTESRNTASKPGNQAPQSTNPSRLTQSNTSFSDEERKQIDKDNRNRLAAMSAEEIEEERRELLAQLDPSLIERLLKRANLDDGRGDIEFEPALIKHDRVGKNIAAENLKKEDEPVSVPIPSGQLVQAPKSVRFEEDEAPTEPIDLQPASQPFNGFSPEDLPAGMHFPAAPSAPELNPSDPSFLENLHTKYFPSLPADPSKLAWMAPIPTHGSVADQESSYYPGQSALSASALRFDFRGSLLPPRIARAMPVTKGLHHHGDAPEAAGYTIAELSRLARSSFPAQRCIAFQTLGRFLYRLGRGDFGSPDSVMVKDLWKCVETGKVVETLEAAANMEGGHQGSKTYAVEAVWLWQKGGGQRVWQAA